MAPLTKNTIHVKVKQVRTTALVDTGASISCVSERFLSKVGYGPAHYHPCSLTEVIGVGGEKHPVLGVISLGINVGNLLISHSFYVFKHIHHPLILGLDFLDKNRVIVDLPNTPTNTATLLSSALQWLW